jgi:hypothetical protein
LGNPEEFIIDTIKCSNFNELIYIGVLALDKFAQKGTVDLRKTLVHIPIYIYVVGPRRRGTLLEPAYVILHHNQEGVFMREWILVLLALAGPSVFAASTYKKSLDVKRNEYLRDGVFIGGQAGTGASLLGLRRTYSGKLQTERVIVDLGDKDANPSGTQVGYFQVSMDAKNQRVILDLAQLMISKVNERQIQETFQKSPYVKSTELTLDPEDHAATLVLNLKGPMKLEVFQIRKAKKPGRVVMDLKPVRS